MKIALFVKNSGKSKVGSQNIQDNNIKDPLYIQNKENYKKDSVNSH